MLLPSTVRHGRGCDGHPWKLLTMLGRCPCLVASPDGVAIAAGRDVLFVRPGGEPMVRLMAVLSQSIAVLCLRVIAHVRRGSCKGEKYKG